MKYFTILLLTIFIPLQCMEDNNTWDGNQYHENSKPQFDRAMAYLKQLTLRPDEHILDVGCGSGKITAEIGHLVPEGRAVGTDPAKLMIAVAQKEFSTGNTSFQVSKAEELTFHECFDRVVSFAAFHWIEDQAEAFKKCAQALKRGGMLHVLTSGETAFASPAMRAFYKTVQGDKWQQKLQGARIQRHLFPLSEAKARELLELAHLEPKEITLKPETLTLPSITHFKKFISAFAKGGYPFFGALQESEQTDLLEDFTHEYTQLVPANSDGTINYPALALTIVAMKK